MAFIFTGVLNWLRSLFFAKHLEVTIVGLQVSLLKYETIIWADTPTLTKASGKTS